MLRQGFPASLQEEVTAVLGVLQRTHEFPHNLRYTLPDGEQITFPYRIYWPEPKQEVIDALTPTQQVILHAIFTRSHDGYARERHLRALLATDYPDWVMPYLLKLADEYVPQILQVLYDRLSQTDCTRLRAFCQANLDAFCYGHDRMISYWDCFHRDKCLHFRDYVGKRLFEECFGYTRSMEKQRRKRPKFSTIVCFGDSNTYGFDPRSFFGSRYPADSRWPDVLKDLSGLDIRTDGMNGREIPRRPWCCRGRFDLLIVMLGTNDLLRGASAAEAAERMEAYLRSLPIGPSQLLLVAPPPMGVGDWVTPELAEGSKALGAHYRRVANRLGIRFLDAGEWDIPLCFDGVHFTEEGHRRFAGKLWDALTK